MHMNRIANNHACCRKREITHEIMRNWVIKINNLKAKKVSI